MSAFGPDSLIYLQKFLLQKVVMEIAVGLVKYNPVKTSSSKMCEKQMLGNNKRDKYTAV